MSAARERLPNRRACESFAFDVGQQRYVATLGRYPDGRIGEIFLSNGKAGSDVDVAARDSAVVCSIALQFGADVETIRRALSRDSRGAPFGPLGALLDLIAAERGEAVR